MPAHDATAECTADALRTYGRTYQRTDPPTTVETSEEKIALGDARDDEPNPRLEWLRGQRRLTKAEALELMKTNLALLDARRKAAE